MAANNPFATNPFGAAAAAAAPSNPFAVGMGTAPPAAPAAVPASNPFSSGTAADSSSSISSTATLRRPPRPSVTGLSWSGGGNAVTPVTPAPATLPPPEIVPDDLGDEQLSYIEMMCSTPRADNAEARAILAPDQAATRAEKHQVQIRAELSKKTEAIDMQKGGQRCSLKEIENGLKGLIAGTIMPTNLDPDITLGSLITRTIRKKKKVPPTEPDSSIVPAGLALGAMFMKGALTKQGGIRKNWLDRWFVLNLATRTLKYYTDKSESQQKGVINVMDIVMAVHPQGELGSKFSIVTNTGRTYHLSATSVPIMDAWITGINGVSPGDQTAAYSNAFSP